MAGLIIFHACGPGVEGNLDASSQDQYIEAATEESRPIETTDENNETIETDSDPSRVNLSPAAWPEGELEAYTRLQNQFGTVNLPDTAQSGMISGTTSALAIRSGLEALLQGGSAADAVLVTALAQVVLVAGSYVSFGGILLATCYDAAEQKVYHLNAAYNTPLYEDDPRSIPKQGSGIPSGRTALVPGFFAGVEALAEKLGALPFESLFEPAIYFAEEGFEMNSLLASYIELKQDVLSRLPQTKAIFTDKAGEFYRAGDWFTQPELAEILRQVAQEGSQYIYAGEWAENFVSVVQDQGGKICMEDMLRYEVIWSEPITTSFQGYQIATPGHPSLGGVNTVEAFNVLEAANYPEQGNYQLESEALFWFAQIHRLFLLGYFDPEALDYIGKGLDLSAESRATKETAAGLWKLMEAGEFYFTDVPLRRTETHSDSVVAIDPIGNVCALTHSINTIVWGETGIFVDGISIPDSACFQQEKMMRVGPGNRLPEETNPIIILQEGSPVLASASIGMTHYRTLAVLYNWLAFDPNIYIAREAPYLLTPDLTNFPDGVVERAIENTFSPELITGVRDLGLLIEEVPFAAAYADRGWWVGIQRDPVNGELIGMTPDFLNGAVIGY